MGNINCFDKQPSSARQSQKRHHIPRRKWFHGAKPYSMYCDTEKRWIYMYCLSQPTECLHGKDHIFTAVERRFTKIKLIPNVRRSSKR